MGVPALAYTVQGNLLFVALAHLEAPTYQVLAHLPYPYPYLDPHLEAPTYQVLAHLP